MEIRLMKDEAGYDIVEQGEQLGRIVWNLEGNTMIMNGTYVHERLRGQDMGVKLLNIAADYARENNYKMQAVCPYIVKMFERSDRYNDVKL